MPPLLLATRAACSADRPRQPLAQVRVFGLLSTAFHPSATRRSKVGPLVVRGFRRVPHVLTVRTQETPPPRMLVGEHGLGPEAHGAVDIRDPSDLRRGHSPQVY